MRRGGGEGHHSGSRAMGRMVLPSLKESPSEGVRMREKERRRRSDEDDSSHWYLFGLCSIWNYAKEFPFISLLEMSFSNRQEGKVIGSIASRVPMSYD